MKRWKIVLAAGIVVLGCAGCGSRGTESTEPTEDISVSGEQEESAEVQEAESEEIENGEITVFAEQIQAAVSDKDMDALADLCAYPLAVNDEIIESRDAFMELGADVIFTEERCAVIAAVDTAALEETMAGVIMGDATPNIIFKSVDGKLGITGIN